MPMTGECTQGPVFVRLHSFLSSLPTKLCIAQWFTVVVTPWFRLGGCWTQGWGPGFSSHQVGLHLSLSFSKFQRITWEMGMVVIFPSMRHVYRTWKAQYRCFLFGTANTWEPQNCCVELTFAVHAIGESYLIYLSFNRFLITKMK